MKAANLSTKIDLSTCDASMTSRNKVRVAFLEREKKEIASYISDLEATISINKAIIQDICCANSKDSNSYKQAISKLNEENLKLTRQLKDLKKERDEALGKVLILEQMIDEVRSKDNEQINELKEKNEELLEQLNLKEYHLQTFEKRCNDAEALVIKYLKNVPEVIEALGENHTQIPKNISISNVVIQNAQLKQKMNDLTSEVNRLKKELSSSETKKLIDILKIKLNGLITENDQQKMKIDKQNKLNEELYHLNEELSDQLCNLNKQVSILMHEKRINSHAETLYTQRARDPPRENFVTEIPVQKERKHSLGELSSISVGPEDADKYLQDNGEVGVDDHFDLNKLEDKDIDT